jgi:hypothetical protein
VVWVRYLLSPIVGGSDRAKLISVKSGVSNGSIAPGAGKPLFQAGEQGLRLDAAETVEQRAEQETVFAGGPHDRGPLVFCGDMFSSK